jgi:UDP-N-acetylglucosamine 2-epimerase (non-hydrolysing)
MVDILTVIGTRPEIIRMSVLVPLLDGRFDHRILFTSQHYSKEMCDVFFRELGVRMPDRFLDLRTSNTEKLVWHTCREIEAVKPKYVLVYGDTNSTLAGALAAKKANARVIHVEAGFRSFDRRMIEENNRIMVDGMSNVLFTPTDFTKRLLSDEGIEENVFVVGDVTIDIQRKYSKWIKKSRIIQKLGLRKEKYVLFTAHRQENVDNQKRLLKIIRILKSFDKDVVYPVHPRTRKMLSKFRFKMPDNVIQTRPLGYFDFLKLEQSSSFIITDSGGVQGEALAFGIPCITIRETTERWEAVMLGANFLAGLDPLMVSYYRQMIEKSGLKAKLKGIKNPYGEGKTSGKIAKILERFI